ncbi:unnamed protein product [Amoebophrya sp. A25]|nr:unnamed protein product [Amoebophrya sp. A25]|eukprot:GSA25T00004961001.1
MTSPFRGLLSLGRQACLLAVCTVGQFLPTVHSTRMFFSFPGGTGSAGGGGAPGSASASLPAGAFVAGGGALQQQIGQPPAAGGFYQRVPGTDPQAPVAIYNRGEEASRVFQKPAGETDKPCLVSCCTKGSPAATQMAHVQGGAGLALGAPVANSNTGGQRPVPMTCAGSSDRSTSDPSSPSSLASSCCFPATPRGHQPGATRMPAVGAADQNGDAIDGGSSTSSLFPSASMRPSSPTSLPASPTGYPGLVPAILPSQRLPSQGSSGQIFAPSSSYGGTPSYEEASRKAFACGLLGVCSGVATGVSAIFLFAPRDSTVTVPGVSASGEAALASEPDFCILEPSFAQERPGAAALRKAQEPVPGSSCWQLSDVHDGTTAIPLLSAIGEYPEKFARAFWERALPRESVQNFFIDYGNKFFQSGMTETGWVNWAWPAWRSAVSPHTSDMLSSVHVVPPYLTAVKENGHVTPMALADEMPGADGAPAVTTVTFAPPEVNGVGVSTPQTSAAPLPPRVPRRRMKETTVTEMLEISLADIMLMELALGEPPAGVGAEEIQRFRYASDFMLEDSVSRLPLTPTPDYAFYNFVTALDFTDAGNHGELSIPSYEVQMQLGKGRLTATEYVTNKMDRVYPAVITDIIHDFRFATKQHVSPSLVAWALAGGDFEAKFRLVEFAEVAKLLTLSRPLQAMQTNVGEKGSYRAFVYFPPAEADVEQVVNENIFTSSTTSGAATAPSTPATAPSSTTAARTAKKLPVVIFGVLPNKDCFLFKSSIVEEVDPQQTSFNSKEDAAPPKMLSIMSRAALRNKLLPYASGAMIYEIPTVGPNHKPIAETATEAAALESLGQGIDG